MWTVRCGAGVILAAFAVIVCGWCARVHAESSRAPLVKHGNNSLYSYDLLIALSESVGNEYQNEIIDGLEEYMTNASLELNKATYGAFQLGKITIFLPSSWNVTSRNVTPAVTESYDRANVIVEQASLAYGHNPYTKQIGGCGKRGEYIHLTPKYIYDTNNTAIKISKNVGRAIAHELGHLLWGIYDEYPLPDQQRFYRDASGKIQPIGCTSNLSGTIKYKGTGKECKQNNPIYLDKTTGLFVKECVFIPNDNQTDTAASLMNIHYLGKVNRFCGINSSHNSEAPNLHNRLCGGRSAAEVIEMVENATEGDEKSKENVTRLLTFAYVRKTDRRRLVLVIDVKTNENITEMILDGVGGYIRNILEKNTLLAVVTTQNDSASVLINFTKITTENCSQNIAEKIQSANNSDGVYSCTACGIKKAKELLNGTEGTRDILLITSTDLKDARDAIDYTTLTSGYDLDVAQLGNKKNKNLKRKVKSNGGLYRFVNLKPNMKRKVLMRKSSKLRDFLLNVETRHRHNSRLQQIFKREEKTKKKKVPTATLR